MRKDAAEEAVARASETVGGISGVAIEDRTANVENGQITECWSTVEIAFPAREGDR